MAYIWILLVLVPHLLMNAQPLLHLKLPQLMFRDLLTVIIILKVMLMLVSLLPLMAQMPLLVMLHKHGPLNHMKTVFMSFLLVMFIYPFMTQLMLYWLILILMILKNGISWRMLQMILIVFWMLSTDIILVLMKIVEHIHLLQALLVVMTKSLRLALLEWVKEDL